MKHGEFIKHVQERAGVHDLASQLPQELQEYVRPRDKVGERFGVEEFVNRVAAAAKVDGETARRGARAVAITLREAVTPGEWDDVMAQLPAEYSQIAEPATA
jgi:uncharacterized protein (DUF2267 family)